MKLLKKQFLAGLLLIATIMTSIPWPQTTDAASYKITYKKLSSYNLYHNKWTSKAKFGSGGGTTTEKTSSKAKLHYVNGAYGYCAYMQDSTDDGTAVAYNSNNDSRTTWLNKKVGGYPRYMYCGVVHGYLVDKNISLSGISGSSSLMSLSKTERMLLSQAFVWYMQFAGYDRTKDKYAMAIKGISGWSAAKQYVLFDQMYTAAKSVMPYVSVTKATYKLKSGGNSHQPIGVFTLSGAVPVYANVSYSKAGSGTQEVTLNVNKKDYETDAPLAGAKFQFSCDGEVVGTGETDAEGKLSYVYNRPLKTETYSSTKKYVSNWSSLTAAVQASVTKNGYYMNKAKALQAAQTEVNTKVNQALNSLKSKTHNWEIAEIEAPYGHKLSQNPVQQVVEGTTKTFQFTFSNAEAYKLLKLKKRSAQTDYGVEASFKDAVYGLYAKEEILGTDNKTVIYQPDAHVATLRTDASGNAELGDLYPGIYYLKELQAPKGFELDDTPIEVDLRTADKEITVSDAVIQGQIQINKTFDGQFPEVGAEFEIYNKEEILVDTVVMNEQGRGISDLLPYGTYKVIQSKGKEGYERMIDQIVKIDGSQQVIEISEDDELEYAGIAITKTTLVDDAETGSYEKKAEQGAEFEILDGQGLIVDTMVTDEKGIAKSKALSPGTYTVHQSKGADNFEKIKDFTVTIGPDDHTLKRFDAVDRNTPRKVRVQKTKSRNGNQVPEANAVFTILDGELARDYKTADLSTEAKREAFLQTLDAKAVIGEIVTDAEGKGAMLLNDLASDQPFLVLQTKGAEGYLLADPYDSTEHQSEEEGLVEVYEITADDALDEWAKIMIRKELVTGRGKDFVETQPESGLEFQILNAKGEVVETLVTDAKGEAVSGELDYGVYVVQQMTGTNTHENIQPQRIVLTKEDKRKTIEYEFLDEEKWIDFILTKKSAATEILLDNATYEIYNEAGEKMANLTTGLDGEKGTAACKLPYGTYTLKEVVAPDGYKCNQPSKFVLSMFSVDYDEDGNGVFQLEDQDEPVYGEIGIDKSGNALTGFYDGNFQYESKSLSGVEFQLYARNDIKLDDSTVLWKAGTVIDTKVSDTDGHVQFSWMKDEKLTTKFPCGEYYIKETKAPYGYVLDETEHEVVITWDSKAGDLNEDDKKDEGDAEEKPEPVRPEAGTGPYVLCKGELLNEKIQNATKVTFTWENAPTDAVDVSADGDGTVVLWSENETEYFISTQKAGQDILFNVLSRKMFQDCENLTEIYFDNIDTALMVDADKMFAGCSALETLDISMFNMENVKFANQMFYGCLSLTTVYAPDSELLHYPPQPAKQLVEMKAQPQYEFLLGMEYSVDDFIFHAVYNDGSSEEVTLSAEEVQMTPQIASPLGEQEVEFVLSEDSKYAEAGTFKTKVMVVDTPSIEQDGAKDIIYNLELENTLKTYTIEFPKINKNGEPLEGAEFTLYAAADIVDAKGNLLFKQGDAIATAVSEIQDGEDAIVSFQGLPTNLYKKNSKEEGAMFTVKETKAPMGHKKSFTGSLSFAADVTQYGNSSALIHTYTEPGSDKDGTVVTEGDTTYIYDAKPIENEEIPYITLYKTWNDGGNTAGRPEEVVIHVTTPDGVKDYTLTAENDWMIVTDILKTEFNNCKFEEEFLEGWHDELKKYISLGAVEFINTPSSDKTKLAAKKIWKDADNQDGIRPDSVEAILYQNGKEYDRQALTEENGWMYYWQQLPLEDSEGNLYEYDVKEAPFNQLTGDPETGYSVNYRDASPTAANGYPCTTIEMVNLHEPKLTNQYIEKVWSDYENKDRIRPDSIQVDLLADGKVERTVTLNASNGWKTTIKNLPAYQNGTEIKYTWKEQEADWLTGNVNTGYEATYAYTTQQATGVENETQSCVLTNTHASLRGKLAVYKYINKNEIQWDTWTPTFTFHLKGTTLDGQSIEQEKTVTFTKAEVDAQGTDLVKLGTVFEELEAGTYTVTESGTENYYELETIQSDTNGVVITGVNGTILKDNRYGTVNDSTEKPKSATVTIGVSDEEMPWRVWDAEVSFVNRVRRGEVNITKSDDDGTKLQGVTFALIDATGKQIETGTTDAEGKLSFHNLEVGSYTIQETKTLPGKTLLTEPIKVTVPLVLTEEQVNAQHADTSKAVHSDGKYYYYGLSFDVTNSAALDLPATGGKELYLLLAAGIGFILLAIIWKRKRK